MFRQIVRHCRVIHLTILIVNISKRRDDSKLTHVKAGRMRPGLQAQALVPRTVRKVLHPLLLLGPHSSTALSPGSPSGKEDAKCVSSKIAVKTQAECLVQSWGEHSMVLFYLITIPVRVKSIGKVS